MSYIIDTGAEGGSQGPWISFKPKGSAKNGFPYKSWVLRDKDGDENTITLFKGMESGVVLDLYVKGGELCGSLKLGHSKSDGIAGVPPERRWWPSPTQRQPRPDDSKKAQGGYAWSNALSLRCAIGGGKTATWEDDGWGVYKGFDNLVKKLNTEFGANEGLCPMVRVTGYSESGSGQNTTFIPIFEIMKWVPRPDCLKADAPKIDTGEAETPPPAKVAPKAEPAPEIADLNEF